jgi:cation diffusion facilitator family transporter
VAAQHPSQPPQEQDTGKSFAGPPSAGSQAVRVTLNGMYLDLALGFAKIVGGTLTASFALIADGIHSLSDAVTDIFVLIVSHFAHDAPDEEHPYGHGRFETIGTVVMGMVLFAIAGILLYDSYLRLNREMLAVPTWGGFLIAAVSVGSKEWIYHYTMRTANRLNSSLLRANAWHSRTDAISSIAVMGGILGAQQGFPWLDVVAAMFVALIIGKIGWQLSYDALKELVDTAIPKRRQRAIREKILGINGIHEVRSLRGRQSGGQVLVEAQILVDPRISVSEGHRLGEAARHAVTESFADINDVIIHIDPEAHDYTNPLPSAKLPLRDQILLALEEKWRGLLDPDCIGTIDLHYLHDSIEVDLHLLRKPQDPAVIRRLGDALRPLRYISRLKVYSDLTDTAIHEHPASAE